MFSEFLGLHPLSSMLSQRIPPLFPSAGDREAWGSIPEAVCSSLRGLSEEYAGIEYPLLKASDFMAFGRVGDRGIYERPYFLRRKKLCAAVLGICESGNDATLDTVVDGLWLICEESSWVISAHNGSAHEGVPPASERLLPDVTNPYVDLFAAQTAMILSLTCQLLSEALDAVSPLIRRRVRDEIESRVLKPFEHRDDFWWMGILRRDLCNWTPWIVSNVMLTACAWVQDRLRLCALLNRGCQMLDRYLEVLPGDGSCDEGPGYWNMAGGALLDCLDLLERVTGGKMSFWNDEKLRNILCFPQKAWMGGSWFMNYADCDAKPDIPGERLLFAGEKLNDPNLTAFGVRFLNDPASLLEDTPQFWRLLNGLFHETPRDCPEALPPEDVWLEGLQARILHRDGLTLVCKGGVNEGSHNHNDCGSFMVYLNGEPQLVDAGNMTYTGKTFSGERYSLWNIRSCFHNVPMIGEYEQVNGWERRAMDVACEEDGLSMDLSKAYPDAAGLLECRRSVCIEAHSIVLRDVIHIQSSMPVTEVFMLRQRPEALGLRIIAPEDAVMKLQEIPITDPRMAKSFPGSLWRLTYTCPASQSHDILFRLHCRQ